MAKENLCMFLTGLSVGVVGAVLLAPAAGSETRSRVRGFAGEAGDRIKDHLTKGSNFVADLKDQARQKLDDTVDATKNAANEAVNASKSFAHEAGRRVETQGQRLQAV